MQRPPDTVRIVTWNLWWRFGPWEARQEAIAATLSALDADVVCLQEVWALESGDDQAAVLAERSGLHLANPPQQWFGDGLSFRNAILSRWPAIDVGVTPMAGVEGKGGRTIVAASLPSPHGIIPVVTTHFSFEYDASAVRSRQSDVLARVAAARRADVGDDAFPLVVTGDLNAVPMSDEIRMLTGHAPVPVPGLVLHDVWEQCRPDDAGFTWSAANPYLETSTWPNRRLDYVFVGWPRARPKGNPVQVFLAGCDPVDGIVPSDHFAVVADLRTA